MRGYTRQFRGSPRAAGTWVVLALLAVAGPAGGQASDEGGLWTVDVQPVVRSQLHDHETGWAAGVRVDVMEGEGWGAGVSYYGFVNDIDTAPARTSELSLAEPLATAEHYRRVSMGGVHGWWTVWERPRYRLALEGLAGLVHMTRVLEYYELFAFDADGTPLNLATIATGDEVMPVLEPALRLDVFVTRRLRLGGSAGYLWAGRPWEGNTSLTSPGVTVGVGYTFF